MFLPLAMFNFLVLVSGSGGVSFAGSDSRAKVYFFGSGLRVRACFFGWPF